MWGSLGGTCCHWHRMRDRVWVTKERRQSMGQLNMPAGYLKRSSRPSEWQAWDAGRLRLVIQDPQWHRDGSSGLDIAH